MCILPIGTAGAVRVGGCAALAAATHRLASRLQVHPL